MQIDFQFVVLLTGFVLTLGTLIWRMAVLHQQCITNKEIIGKAHNRIDKLEDTQSHKVEDLTKELQLMKESQARMEEKLNQLLSMERIKIKQEKKHEQRNRI